MPDDIGILTYFLQRFIEIFASGHGRILPDAMSLIEILVVLEISIVASWMMIEQTEAKRILLRQLLKVSFFIFVLNNYPMLIGAVVNGFVTIGIKAGGSNVSIADLTDPSKIMGYGIQVVTPILEVLSVWSPIDAAIYLMCMVVILAAFVVIAIQLFVTFIEFYLVATLSLILIPFGVSRHFSFMAERVLGGVVTYGTRLMVLAFVVSVAEPLLDQLTISNDAPLKEVLAIVVATLCIAALSWHAPSIASGMVSGSPTLTAGTAASTTIAAGATVAAVGLGASGIASGAASAASSGIKAASNIAGGASTAYRLGAATSIGGSGAQMLSGLRGVASAGIRSASQSNIASGLKQRIQHNVASSFKDGGIKAYTNTGGSGFNNLDHYLHTNKPKSFHPMKMAVMARRMMPAESASHSGLSIPIGD